MESVFVILLLTGFCGSSVSVPTTYYFVRESMTWDEAELYCFNNHIALAEIHNKDNVSTLMSTAVEGHADRAWIGLYENSSEWTWVDGEPATSFNWSNGVPDSIGDNNFCVSMNGKGLWTNNNCSENKFFVCDRGYDYHLSEKEVTWNDAITLCKNKKSSLAKITDRKKISSIKESLKNNEAWIGLNMTQQWYLSETSEVATFTNWQSGQPNNPGMGLNCAATMLKDGKWTDEPCSATYPFFCSGMYKSRKTVVKMKLQSSTNLDLVVSTKLKQQLRQALAKQGMTDFKLTWKKQPVKQTQESNGNKDAC